MGQLQNKYTSVYGGIKSKHSGRVVFILLKLSSVNFFCKLKYWGFLGINGKPGRKEKLNKNKPRIDERTTSDKST